MQGRWGRARIELIIGLALVGATIAGYMLAKHYRWIGWIPIGLVTGLAAMPFLYADAMEDRERKRRHRRRKP